MSDRTDLAYAATTLAELERSVADLPNEPGDRPEAPMPEEAQVRRWFGGHLTTYGLVVFLLVVWALTGAGPFWPVWRELGVGIGIAVDSLRTREEIEELRFASPQERRAVVARNAERRRRDGHGRSKHGFPTPPGPPATVT